MHGILCINKPKGWTSFDVVNKVSRFYRTKVGHTGTLDPQATGVLVCLVGLTKALPFIDSKTKRYQATCQLGLKTDTGDIWGKTIQKQSISPVTKEQLKTVLVSFMGQSSQRVPMTSAKKVKGKKLIHYQREKIEVQQQYTNIEIFDIKLLSISETSFEFEALVSHGTYIRTLCEDIAQKLNNIGTMSSLVRTENGPFKLSDCIDIEDLGQRDLIPIAKGLSHYKSLEIDDIKAIYNGKNIKHEYIDDQIAITHHDEIVAIYQYDDQIKEYRSQRGLWM